MKKYFLHIFGCQMNYSDAERIATVMEGLGWQKTDDRDDADAYFFVTCSVRQKAEDKVHGFLKALHRWKKARPGRQIGLTGCMARVTGDRDSEKQDKFLTRKSPLDFVWRIEETARLPELLGAENLTDSPKDYFGIVPTASNPAQAFVPIMTGCDNFCTYCIVPHARGREVSRNPEEVLAECRAVLDRGAIEITLIGQNVDSYQKTPGAFAELLEKVAELPGLQRLRFTSSHPKDMTDSVIEVMERHDVIERHLHLPAQHGDDEILRRMNRNYTAADYLALLGRFRAALPEATVSTDLIVGFPGETDEQFENLLQFYRDGDFDFSFIARYSPRPETPAAKMDGQISDEVKATRWNKLNDLLVETTAKKYACLDGKHLAVLVEKVSEDGIAEGRSHENFLVKFPGSEDDIGKIVAVKVTEPRAVELRAEKISSQKN